MRIAILLDRARLFRWHLALIEALATARHTPVIRYRETSDPLPTTLTAILDFDYARGHSNSDSFSKHLKPQAFDRFIERTGAPADITLDLSSASTIQRLAGPVLRPFYDGSPKDYALFHALLDRRAPHLTLWHSELEKVLDVGQPALEEPSRLATSMDQVTSRLVEGLLRYFAGTSGHTAHVLPISDTHPRDPNTSILVSASGFISARTLRKARRLTDTFSGDAPRWHTAWRPLPGAPNISPGVLNLVDYKILADDGARSYADPFVFPDNGTAHIFLAESQEVTGHSIIAHTIVSGGNIATPEPVLSIDVPLAHPFVFAQDGAIWMLPEQSAAGGLDLYRCTDFPGTWVREARLIDGRIHDATLFAHDGLLWIAAACEAFQSSTWDGLGLYWSKSLTGPWNAHPLNPVIVDAQSARPAGAVWHADGQLYRPAQDCSSSFGSAVSIQRIAALTRDTFAEETAGSLAFAPGQHLSGPHAISRGGGIEVVDLYARPSAIRAAYRAGYRSAITL
ncbi:MAG: hypothetical protein ABL897_07850 [Hyphomicrobium sp.]